MRPEKLFFRVIANSGIEVLRITSIIRSVRTQLQLYVKQRDLRIFLENSIGFNLVLLPSMVHCGWDLLHFAEKDPSSEGFSKIKLDRGLIAYYMIRIMSNNLNENIEKYAGMFKALSNPNRLKIFLRLVSCCVPDETTHIRESVESEGCACVGDLGKDLGIVASTISHHIKELRQAGLIQMERRGQKIECWIDPGTISALKGFLSTQE